MREMGLEWKNLVCLSVCYIAIRKATWPSTRRRCNATSFSERVPRQVLFPICVFHETRYNYKAFYAYDFSLRYTDSAPKTEIVKLF